jgi:hypothetical protein
LAVFDICYSGGRLFDHVRVGVDHLDDLDPNWEACQQATTTPPS